MMRKKNSNFTGLKFHNNERKVKKNENKVVK